MTGWWGLCILGCGQEAASISVCIELARAELLGQKPKCGYLSQVAWQPVPPPTGGLFRNWALWTEVFGDRQGDFV